MKRIIAFLLLLIQVLSIETNALQIINVGNIYPVNNLMQWIPYQDPACVGAWFLNNDLGLPEADRSGEGNTLTVSASDTIPRSSDIPSGETGYSRDFERGDVEILEGADGTSLDINGADAKISLSAWIKPENVANSTEYIIAAKYNTGANGRSYKISILGTGTDVYRVYFTVSSGGVSVTNQTTDVSNYSVGTWKHIVAVSNDIDLRIYIDGVLATASPTAYTSGLFNSAEYFSIGSYYGSLHSLSSAGCFDGLIKDVAVFNRGLTADEASFLYTYGLRGNTQHAKNYIQYASCKGAWYLSSDGSASETDRTPNGNTLTVTSGDTIERSTDVPTGYTGYSRDFTYTDQESLYCSDGSSLDITGNKITITCWVKFEADTVNNQWIVSKWRSETNGRQYGLWFYDLNDKIVFYVSPDGTNNTNIQSNATGLFIGSFVHIACVADGSYLRLYINGTEAASPVAFSSSIFNGTSTFDIGGLNGVATSYTNGLVKEVAVFDDALSENEILDIYENGIDGTRGAGNSIDLTAFTEIDSASDITITTSRATFDSIRRDADSYVYKDYGADYFGNFSHDYTLRYSTYSGTSAFSETWAVSNIIGSVADHSGTGSGIWCGFDTPSSGKFKLECRENSISASSTISFAYNTSYYMRVKRSSTAISCYIYSDPERRTLLDSMSITGVSTKYRYLYCIMSRDNTTAPSDYYSGYVEDIKISE